MGAPRWASTAPLVETPAAVGSRGAPDGTVTDTLWTAFGPLINFTIPSLDAAIDLTPADIIPAGFDVPLL